MGWYAVFLREALLMRRRWWRLLSSMSVSPLLYLVAFGYALGSGTSAQGRPYLEFLLPGLAAMSSMNQAWAIASEINVARFYWRIFEEFQAAPLSAAGYVLGEVLAGILRAALAVMIILLLGAAFGVRLHWGPWFWLAAGLNSLIFAALAVALAMRVKSHADQALLTSFVITPMAFLGGTVFPVERLPVWARWAVEVLPLTHASRLMRAAAQGSEIPWLSLALLVGLGGVFFLLAWSSVGRARD
ncbi:MAG: ABC transporter permease [Deltaproteobacteria bacterium]|nr:ABC transporter permease [Deltaproteobacteria bacterium]